MLFNKLNSCLFIGLYSVSICIYAQWNDPYPLEKATSNTLYTSFSERPKHLDPVRSYSSNEWVITNQIYESPLQYHYLKRPYTVEPLIATQLPEVTFLDKNRRPIRQENLESSEVGYTVYTIHIQPGVYYQPHPALAKNNQGEYLYHQLSEEALDDIYTLQDFAQTDTRELIAEDFVYQIKRIGDSSNNSPIFGLMQEYIDGLDEFEQAITEVYKALNIEIGKVAYVDLNQYELRGVKTLDKYTYQVTIKGQYPQFVYWLAMPFFAPMPWEAIKFYAQNDLKERNITLDWYPIGTGPFLLTENNPNERMVLEKNPNYHGETYPTMGEVADKEEGLLEAAGKPLPFLDKVIFTLEKENIPYWNKFLQGYYDQSGISSDSFDQALQSSSDNGLALSEELEAKGIKLTTSVLPSTYYWGFNMLDNIVGGYTADKRKLRQAISIAMDMEEYIQIFENGRGIPAQSPLPPGIFGYEEGISGVNPFVYEIDSKNPNKYKRKSIEIAKQLLAESGYPNGIDPKTQQPLTLYLDATMGGGPDSNALYAWVRKQFKKLGIQLVVRATQYNRFQEKMQTGNAQIFSWGWNADYPDPENFLFLLYGPSGKVKYGGENAVNYQREDFDKLFEKMKVMPNTEERKVIIKKMLVMLQEDAPWIWGRHPKSYALSHAWLGPQKPNAMSRNTIKYLSVDPTLRAKLRKAWNKPIVWPIGALAIGFFLLCIPAYRKYQIKIHSPLVFAKHNESKP